MLKCDLYGVAKHYKLFSQEQFIQDLTASSKISPTTKLKDLTSNEIEILLSSIEKVCGFSRTGSEEFHLLPKIAAKIERPGKEDLYLVGIDVTLTQEEAISWIVSQKLDAVVVHHANGTYLRSRPHYHMQTLKLTWDQQGQLTRDLEVLARMVGQRGKEQCTWGFINGIRNTKEEAIESSSLISRKAGNELVVSLRNDMFLWGAKEVSVALFLKLGIDTPVIKNAALFLRYLLSLSKNEEDSSPVILFAHSQGAAITEHALALLSNQERQKIRVFTFGGWSFIGPDVAHPESHNFASIGDLIPRVGSYNLQCLAIRRYEGLKEGLSHDEIILRLAFRDAIHDLDCLNPHVQERYTQERCKFYRTEFEKISNVTVVDSGSIWEHSFNNESYQYIVNKIIERYQKNQTKVELINSEDSVIRSYV